MEKIWITRAEMSTKEEPTISIWYKQKPAWSNGSLGNTPCWWCNCKGKRDIISRNICKLLFGCAPVKHEIYTIEIENNDSVSNFKIVLRQTPKDYFYSDLEIRPCGVEW